MRRLLIHFQCVFIHVKLTSGCIGTGLVEVLVIFHSPRGLKGVRYRRIFVTTHVNYRNICTGMGLANPLALPHYLLGFKDHQAETIATIYAQTHSFFTGMALAKILVIYLLLSKLKEALYRRTFVITHVYLRNTSILTHHAKTHVLLHSLQGLKDPRFEIIVTICVRVRNIYTGMELVLLNVIYHFHQELPWMARDSVILLAY